MSGAIVIVDSADNFVTKFGQVVSSQRRSLSQDECRAIEAPRTVAELVAFGFVRDIQTDMWKSADGLVTLNTWTQRNELVDRAVQSDDIGVAAARAVAEFNAEPPLSEAMKAFQRALDDLIEFVANDTINYTSGQPNGRSVDPNSYGLQQAQAVVYQAALEAFSPYEPLQPAAAATEPRPKRSPFTVVHNPDARRVIACGDLES